MVGGYKTIVDRTKHTGDLRLQVVGIRQGEMLDNLFDGAGVFGH